MGSYEQMLGKEQTCPHGSPQRATEICDKTKLDIRASGTDNSGHRAATLRKISRQDDKEIMQSEKKVKCAAP